MTNDEAKHCIRTLLEIGGCDGFDYKEKEALDLAIKALDQGDVLEKIREEILDEAEYAYADFDQYKEDILYAEPDELPDDDFRYGLERAVEIINKYKNRK